MQLKILRVPRRCFEQSVRRNGSPEDGLSPGDPSRLHESRLCHGAESTTAVVTNVQAVADRPGTPAVAVTSRSPTRKPLAGMTSVQVPPSAVTPMRGPAPSSPLRRSGQCPNGRGFPRRPLRSSERWILLVPHLVEHFFGPWFRLDRGSNVVKGHRLACSDTDCSGRISY